MRARMLVLLTPAFVTFSISPSYAAFASMSCVYDTHGKAIALVEYQYKDTNNHSDTVRGSGFVIASDGHIITNNHVILPQPADRVTPLNVEKVFVRLGGYGSQALPAQIIRRDVNTDLALLKIDSRTEGWPTVPVGDSTRMRVGDMLTGIGFPNSDLAGVPTSPITALNTIISGERRPWWQTALSLNPGNSGGPVFGKYGTAVGIAVAFRENAQQISFAIPMQYALQLAQAGGAVPLPSGPCIDSTIPNPDKVLRTLISHIQDVTKSMSQGCSGGPNGVPPVNWNSLQPRGNAAVNALNDAVSAWSKNDTLATMSNITQAAAELDALINGVHENCSGGAHGRDPVSYANYQAFRKDARERLEALKNSLN